MTPEQMTYAITRTERVDIPFKPLPSTNKNYKPSYGVAGSGSISADKPSGQVNPFPIKIKKKI